MADLTADDYVKQIRDLLPKTTPGPWEAKGWRATDAEGYTIAGAVYVDRDRATADNDVAIICALRNAAPALLEAWEERSNALRVERRAENLGHQYRVERDAARAEVERLRKALDARFPAERRGDHGDARDAHGDEPVERTAVATGPAPEVGTASFAVAAPDAGEHRTDAAATE